MSLGMIVTLRKRDAGQTMPRQRNQRMVNVPLGVDGAKVSVFEETHEVSLSSLLKGSDGSALEPEIGLVLLSESRG